MNRKRTFQISMLAFLLVALTLVVTPALAGTRVSHGQAMSVLRAFPSGLWAVNLNDGVGAIQFKEFANVAIFPSPFSDGRHYCEDDHQVAMLGFFSSNPTYTEAHTTLDLLSLVFEIDGQTYESIRTPVMHTNLPGATYAFNEGVILAPGDLTVGVHTLAVSIYFDGTFLGTSSADFHLDASGTGVC